MTDPVLNTLKTLDPVDVNELRARGVPPMPPELFTDARPARFRQCQRRIPMRRAPAARRGRRRIPRVALAVILLATTAAGGVGATELLRADDVGVPENIACLETPTQDPNHATFVPTRPDPVAACADLRARGPIGGGSTSVPPLVACAGKDTPVQVVPADSDAICGRLGLAPLPADYDALARVQADAREAVEFVTTARGSCPATAAPLFESMRAALAAAELREWRVVEPDKPEHLLSFCRAEIDARTRTVTIYHSDPVTRMYAQALGQEYGKKDGSFGKQDGSPGEEVTVAYEGRADCPPAAPLIKSLRAALAAGAEPPEFPAAKKLREWRVLAPDEHETSQSCRADVDGRARTITVHVSHPRRHSPRGAWSRPGASPAQTRRRARWDSGPLGGRASGCCSWRRPAPGRLLAAVNPRSDAACAATRGLHRRRAPPRGSPPSSSA